jgi:hypothetical protein
LDRGDYRRTIETWESSFHPSQFLYLLHDDIEESPRRELTRVCAFLSLSAAPLDSGEGERKRVNPAAGGPMPASLAVAVRDYYAPQLPFLERKLGRSLRHWLEVR